MNSIAPGHRAAAETPNTHQRRSYAVRPDPSRISIRDVVSALRPRIVELCHDLLPNGSRQGRQYRAGSLAGEAGSAISVELAGPKQGIWCDHRTGEGGDPLNLVAVCKFAGNIREALGWARDWLGEVKDPVRSSPRPATVGTMADGRRNEGLRLFLAGQPDILGTPVERYLTHERGIPVAESLAPGLRSLRYHPGIWNGESRRHWPAMVAAIVDPAGKTVAAHLTWLEIRGDGRVTKAPLANPKMTYGGWKGGAIRLWRGASGKPWKEAPAGDRLVITEGIEDGLSCAAAAPERRVIAAVNLSNIANLVIPAAIAETVIAAQNDPWWHDGLSRPHPAGRGLDRAIRALAAQGKVVLLARSPRGKDFNDLVRGGE